MQINWHKYPDEYPPKNNRYLTTIPSKSEDAHRYVDITFWDGNREYWYTPSIYDPIAWAELPEPYEPPKRDPYYNHPDEITARKYMERDPETLKALGIFD